MQPIYVSKTLVAASSNGLGSISTAATPVVTVNTSNMDTGRRVVFYSTGDASSLTLTYTGKGEQRVANLVESVKGSTANGIAATTTSDFLSLTSVTYSSAPNIPILIGTSSVGGVPWKAVNWNTASISVSAGITFTTSANGMTASIDMTMDDFTNTYPNPNLSVPGVFNSTSHVVSASTNSWGIVNTDGQYGSVPFAGWRLTITSSSSSAGSVYATVIQSG